jgi:hypothetical protein
LVIRRKWLNLLAAPSLKPEKTLHLHLQLELFTTY